MITDSLNNAEIYCSLHKGFKAAFDFLKKQDLAKLPAGRYEIDGDSIFAMVQEPALLAPENAKWEAHKKYIDIQYVVSGTEGIGYNNLNTMTEQTPYDAERDIAFYTGKGSIVAVHSGEFMLLYPQDAHMPLIDVADCKTLKKVVVKVKL
ncbi:MAG TPA: YhcH/YjgK/YiaL family protein [Ruminococcaceae bacterium]|nr:YhcH/YjgK/YiaL family protein [Oscillospiraceae bacterium]